MARWMGVLALEPVAGSQLTRPMLSRAAAERLVPLLGQQLGRYLSADHAYGLAWAAAAFDPAQLLRRGFPVHHELGELFHAGQRQGLGAGQTLTLAERDGLMPTSLLTPDRSLGNGPLLAIPVVLSGSEEAIALGQSRLEAELFEAGLADPNIVMELAADLGVSFEHVRWLSLMDLVAMMATQLDNVGFGGAWQLIEEVLLGAANAHLDASSALGQALQLDDDAVWIDFLSYSLYARLPGTADDADTRLSDYLARLTELRQLQALFAAHAVALRIRLPSAAAEHACSRTSDDVLVEALGDGVASQVLIHEHAALGVVAFSTADALGQPIEHRYPLSAAAIGREVAAIKSAALRVLRPGSVVLSGDGLDLAAPELAGSLQ
jgi:hypothetical protein